MKSDAAGYSEINPPPGTLDIKRKEVFRLAHCGPHRRWADAVRAAIREARSLIAPRARGLPLSKPDLNGLFPAGTPVEAIARRGDRWAIVATIGPRVEARVRRYFQGGWHLEGMLLDAAGSVAVEAMCGLAERHLAGGAGSACFSPGYCGWRLEGQKRLFALLKPEEIGVRLLPSLLMRPLKSITGLVVRASPEALLVPAEACEQCDAQGCTRRRARFLK